MRPQKRADAMPPPKPCKRGHTSGRYQSGSCIECMALRKGRKGRSVPPTRLDRLETKTIATAREELKLRRAQARAERQQLRIKAREKKIEENKLNNIDLRFKPKPKPKLACDPRLGIATLNISQPVKCGPDGRPVPAEPERPVPAPPTGSALAGCKLIETKYETGKKIELWQRPDGSMFENWVTAVVGPEWKPAGINGQPTRAQLAARHTQYSMPANIPKPASMTLGLPDLPGPHGIRQMAPTGTRDGWRHGGADWKQHL